jgi:hypothetical protein
VTTTTLSTYTAGIYVTSPVTTLSITSTGTVAGYGVLTNAKAVYTVDNGGLIDATGASSGVDLAAGGLVTNRQGHTISGYQGINAGSAYYGPSLTSSAIVNNLGVVLGGTGARSFGVYLGYNLTPGATVTNGSASDTNALIRGTVGLYDQVGVFQSVASTITNFATIQGTGAGTSGGIEIVKGTQATIVNGSTLDTSALITGAVGVNLTGDAQTTIKNFGIIRGTGGTAVILGSASDMLVVEAGASFTGAVQGAGGSLALAGDAGTGVLTATNFSGFGAIAFDAGAKWTIVGGTAALSGTISGFANHDTIDLTGFVAATDTFASNVLTLTNAAHVSTTLNIEGNFAGNAFLIPGDGGSGTDIVLCFAAGTRIATPEGASLVEDLAIGDRVHAHFAGVTPIKWIGSRHVDCARHPDPRLVWPVRVGAGAFGQGQPYRDLLLSPNHSVYIEGDLIPVLHLVNGCSIVQLPVDEVTYYHLELAQHDLLMTEGLLTESYLDGGDRSNFINGTEAMRLFPDFASVDVAARWETKGCAPLVIRGPRLEAARRWVNGLAGGVAVAA